MRVLVCGGRDFSDADLLCRELDCIHAHTPISGIIEGGAAGADDLAAKWSAKTGLPQGVRFYADWAKHGRAAGPIRNQRMLDEGKPDLVVAFPGGRGTADMVRRAKKAGVEVLEVS
jgi:YspA, cpYpsA-related SLOG family